MNEMEHNVKMMNHYRRKVTSSKESAITALYHAGILSKKGNIKKPYRKLFKISGV